MEALKVSWIPLGVVVLLAAPTPSFAEPVGPGALVDGIICRDDPGQSYALFLPEAYEEGRDWPILYVLDARQDGLAAARLFVPAAKRFGYIVASSNNSRSDSGMDVNLEAMGAIWRDTQARLAINPNRVYVTGLSGTARAACYMADMAPGTVAGVIACAAGFSPARAPHSGLKFAIYGIVGTTDFNYQEVQALGDRLLELGVPHRMEEFVGGHEWPPPGPRLRALEWLEIQAMRDGRRERDDVMLDGVFRRELEEARRAEQEGRLYQAYRRFRDTALSFEGLLDVGFPEAAVARLGKTRGLKKLRAERLERRESELAYRARASESFAGIGSEDAPAGLDDLLGELERRSIKKRAAEADDAADRLSAQRMLESVFVQTAYYVPRELRQRKDYRREALAFAVAAEIQPDNQAVWYKLAAAYALAGDKREALRALHTAVEKGFRDARQLASDTDLSSLHEEPDFAAIVAALEG